MLPEFFLAWRFLRPVRALLLFLSILLALFMALSQMYWHSYSAYYSTVPPGATAKQYFTLGSDEIDAMGEFNQCMVEQVQLLDDIDQSLVYMANQSRISFDILHPAGVETVLASAFALTSPDFVEFYGLEPKEVFFDAQQNFQERWIYVFDDWYQENTHLIGEYQGYPALELFFEETIGGETWKDTLMVPIAGVLNRNFQPWMDADETKFIASIGLSTWHVVSINGVFEIEPPSLLADDLATSYRNAARLQVVAPAFTTSSELEKSVNQQIFSQPSPCVAQQPEVRTIKVLPGGRTQTSYYNKIAESLNLLSIITLAIGAIVVMFGLAIAQRLPSVRQSEMVIKLAMGAAPKRLFQQLVLEAGLLLLLTLALAWLIYWPMNRYAQVLGFVQGTQINWFVVLFGVAMISFLLGAMVLANRSLQKPELVYQRLNTLRHNIAHKFFALQLTHALYSALIATVVMVMLMLSMAYWAKLVPKDVLANTDYLVVHSEFEDYDSSGFGFGWNASLSNLIRSNPEQVAAACVGWEANTQNWQLAGGEQSPIVPLYSAAATPSFFKNVLGLESATARGALVTVPAAQRLGLSSDLRDSEAAKLANVPTLAADGSLQLRGNMSVQRVIPAFSLPERVNAPYVFTVSRGPECYGTMFVSPQFDMAKLGEISYDWFEPPKRYYTKTWAQYFRDSQPLVQARLVLVLSLSLIAALALVITITLNSRFLISRMQPWYWLNIAQGMPPSIAKRQIMFRMSWLTLVSLLVGALVANSAFYQLFSDIASMLTLKDNVLITTLVVAGILIAQLSIVWWFLRRLSQRDLSAWQVAQ